MPWSVTTMKNERIQFIVEALQPDRNMAALCRKYGVSRKTGYKWLKRFRQCGSLADLDEMSRRPRHSPNRTPGEIEDRVEAWRRQTGWGGRALQPILAREGVRLAASTIDRIIQRKGLTRKTEKAKRATKRFERERPNELWQMDFKGQYPLRRGGNCYPLSLLDDHSRFNVGLYALASQRTAGVQESLIDCFDRCGVPEAMLMDHGTPWWSTTNGHGLTRLSVFLIKQEIDLIYGAYHHPQTQGKVERFHRTLDESTKYLGVPDTLEGFRSSFARFSKTYNELRPHQSLGMKVPAQRYRASRRNYQPSPRKWIYPPNVEVHRLNSAGCIEYRGKRLFVCEALAHEEVSCQAFEEKVLVTYRHMHIRELDLRRGRTRAMVRPVKHQ